MQGEGPGWGALQTHGGLAQRLGLNAQQIQRYEATEYDSASFARICKLVQAAWTENTKSRTAGSQWVERETITNAAPLSFSTDDWEVRRRAGYQPALQGRFGAISSFRFRRRRG